MSYDALFEPMTLGKKKACLIVVDMQNEFLDETGGDFFHNALDIVPNVKRVIAACRKAGIPVVYTGHRHEDPAVDGGMTAEWWPEIKSGRCLVSLRSVCKPLLTCVAVLVEQA